MVSNGVIAGMLSGMDPDYLSSKDPFCTVKEGILFWLAILTLQEIEALKGQTSGVKAIFPNVEYKFGGPSNQGAKTPVGLKGVSPKKGRQ